MTDDHSPDTPLIDEARIAALRVHVMDGVEAAVRRRGRRARLVGGGLTLAVLLLAGGIGAAALVDSPRDNHTLTGSPGDTAADPSQMFTKGTAESMPASADEALSTESAPREDAAVVVTGEARLVTGDPAKTATAFGAWVEGEGGRVDHRADRDEHTEMTVRVPADDATAALEHLRGLGEVESSWMDRLDVTSQVSDLDARIAALRTSVDRLTAILASSATTAEVIEAESSLTQRQAELDSLLAQRAALGEQVDFSMIYVTFDATTEAAHVEPGGFLGGLRTGWDSLIGAVNAVVTAAGVATPWLGMLLVAAGLAWLTHRATRR
ncbi:MAG: DUF4349 domain-containing protein [Aeromicrobium sp.]|uniref:DUF4349 domain-containing protein n=1 Tax=Aeromicrobium sp. TaxID=1871063 RepID=UPI0039E42132